MIHPDRIYEHKSFSLKPGPVIYWMSRDQRVSDNWALIHTRNMADQKRVEMAVVFCLVPEFEGATHRQYSFMIEGLKEVSLKLLKLNIPFYLLRGDPVSELTKFIKDHSIYHVVCDFDPLRIKRNWLKNLIKKNEVNVTEVDSHNIVPCRKASNKLEYGAYTFRPKIKKLLPIYLEQFPNPSPLKYSGVFAHQNIDWQEEKKFLSVHPSLPIIDWIHPGEKNAEEMLNTFLENKLSTYSSKRNDPNLDGTSNLSPYIHFGQISPQKIALEIITHFPSTTDSNSYLEELIVRRELSDNFCFYNPDYDNFQGFHEWARKSLNAHRGDARQYLYSLDEFEQGKTQDPLWNAAQMEMIRTGKMHGYMRMYWAKKILEWTSSPEIAYTYSIFLNDRYELDGRDPNGYAGCAWSIGGVHDRAWSDRPVFGKIRYMNSRGCERKFNVKEYIKKWT